MHCIFTRVLHANLLKDNQIMTDRIITVATFMFPTEAYSLMARLEEEGIECFLGDENIVAVQPFLSNAVGGVKVNIKEIDSEKALLIFKQLKQDNKKEEKKVDEKWVKDFVPVDTFCPECESSQVFRKKFPLYKTILSIIFAPIYLPLAFLTKKHFCADCGHIWKQ